MSQLYSLALDAAVGVSVAELHGTTVGLAVAPGAAAVEAVVTGLMELLPDEVADLESAETFASEALAALDAEDLSFAPLLPDDDEPLEARLEGLVDWVNGFITGVSRRIDAETLPEEVEETLGDFGEIARVEVDVHEDEDSEAHYAELVEFLRAGVLLVQASLE